MAEVSGSIIIWTDANRQMYVVCSDGGRGVAVNNFDDAVNIGVQRIGHGFEINFRAPEDVADKWWPKKRVSKPVAASAAPETVDDILAPKAKKATKTTRQKKSKVVEDEDADPFFGS